MEKDDRLKCLFEETKMVQGVISRMANNTFLIKGWAVTLVVVSLLLIGVTNNGNYLVAFVPLVVFWILDAYFLRFEKLYGVLYDWLIVNRPICDDCLLEMNRGKLEKRFGNQIPSLVRTMFSETPLLLYIFLLVVIALFTFRFLLGGIRFL